MYTKFIDLQCVNVGYIETTQENLRWFTGNHLTTATRLLSLVHHNICLNLPSQTG